jgi:hypothetical protein
MKLQLRYKENTHAAVFAACLNSTDPVSWLKEIDTWGIDKDDLECYVLPSSIRSIEPSGLFVVFKHPDRSKQLQLMDPYTCIDHKLFIPCSTEITPSMHRTELKNILLWDKQVFHPFIGLIGFEPKDKLDLSSLIFYQEPVNKDWSFANAGLPSKPSFNEIRIIQPSASELINSIKEEIGRKPLQHIPKKEGERTFIEKMADTIKLGLYKVIFKILQAGPDASSANSANANSGKDGFQKLQQWLIKNIDELEKRRQDEIKRLLNLFDENTNEALQYAIPLDSPYLNRGSQTSSWRLTRKPVQFNPGKLGGGGIVDSWDVGSYYMDLRTKYLNTAQKEIEKKDFKKAAYIYAHLLGDYNSAANTLQQGKMFREAATLYKDHLKNISAAADCLEKGELYLEAIELNKEMNRVEKVGDLYSIIGQNEKAAPYYEKHIESKISVNDHLDAARVIEEKLDQKERAQEILLEGWSLSYQHESCLKKYFDIVLGTQPGTTNKKIKKIYSTYTPRHKRMSLLNVLEYLNNKSTDAELSETSKEILYEIVYDEAKNGNIQAAHNIKKFLPKDKLIGSDTSRFVSNFRSQFTRQAVLAHFQLDQSIKWIKALWHKNQYLVLGIKNQCLHLARGNWYGNFEYYSWTIQVKQQRFIFISSPYLTSHILLHSHAAVPITSTNLPKNKYFTEALIVSSPIWLHQRLPQFAFTADNEICELAIENNNINLHYYTMFGDLKRSVPCKMEEGFSPGYNYSNLSLAYDNGFFYAPREKTFLVISEAGYAKGFPFDTVIRFMATSSAFSEFRIVISTNKGCLLYKPQGGDLNMQGVFFADQLIPSSITFIQTDRFVITEKKKTYLFHIKDELPYMIRQYETQHVIVDILPTSSRNQFSIVEETGKITFYEIDA